MCTSSVTGDCGGDSGLLFLAEQTSKKKGRGGQPPLLDYYTSTVGFLVVP
jgi:hypothetical protein